MRCPLPYTLFRSWKYQFFLIWRNQSVQRIHLPNCCFLLAETLCMLYLQQVVLIHENGSCTWTWRRIQSLQKCKVHKMNYFAAFYNCDVLFIYSMAGRYRITQHVHRFLLILLKENGVRAVCTVLMHRDWVIVCTCFTYSIINALWLADMPSVCVHATLTVVKRCDYLIGYTRKSANYRPNWYCT